MAKESKSDHTLCKNVVYEHVINPTKHFLLVFIDQNEWFSIDY